MIDEKIGYSYNDLKIVPTTISEINSRSECDTLDIGGDGNLLEGTGNLPIFTAPMSTVINTKNWEIFERNDINVIFPRNIDLNERIHYMSCQKWVALSLKEFEDLFVNQEKEGLLKKLHESSCKTAKVCIDVANGHMKRIYDDVNKAKKIQREKGIKLVIMTGNIASPATYKWICENSLVDYVRLSIGTGAGCTSTSNVGVHYPIASLIDECYKIKSKIVKSRDKNGEDAYFRETLILDTYTKSEKVMSRPYIIADGGIRNYDHINIALALGADYVMIGGLLSSMYESAAPTKIHMKTVGGSANVTVEDDGRVPTVLENYTDYNGEAMIYQKSFNIWDLNLTEEEKKRHIREFTIKKEFYGMSTRKAQKLIDENALLKTSEGCTKIYEVSQTLEQWRKNMQAYLRSAMSYTGKKSLEEFKGKVTLKVCSKATIEGINK